MSEEQRAVLERVARGELSPAEAATLLDELETAATARAAEAPPERAARVRVIRALGMAEIVGDPGVHEVVAEGPHAARRDGDTLVIESEDDLSDRGGFVFAWPFRHGQPRRPHRWGFGDMTPLRVRVNPDLPLEVQAHAGSLIVRDVHAPIRAEVQAGRAEIEGFTSPLDLTVHAGSVRARGRLDQGASHVRCDAGSVQLHLESGSSVRVSARTRWGRVSFEGEEEGRGWTLGNGDGTLDIDSSMGSVRVTADR